MILFWLGFIYLSTGLWGCLWITFSSWSGKESLAQQDGSGKSGDEHFTDPCWSEGEKGLHHFITNQSSLRFRHSLDSHSGISDCQSFLVLSSRCSVQGNLSPARVQCLGMQLHLAPGRAHLVSCFPALGCSQIPGSGIPWGWHKTHQLLNQGLGIRGWFCISWKRGFCFGLCPVSALLQI